MLGNFFLIVFTLLSFSIFNNIFFPKGVGKDLFDNSSSVLLLVGISVILFVLIMYVLQGTIGEIGLFRYNTSKIIEGIMMGWIVSLFAHLRRTRY